MGECKLCKQEKRLVESHIIPKFVFKWMKETGTTYFRNVASPNVRKQDGVKAYLLCNECEQILSDYEKWFANNIFFPYLENENQIFSYGDELGKFIISILWRVFLLDEFHGTSKPYQNEIGDALEEWRIYLLADEKPKEYNEIHLVFVSGEEQGKQTHEYITRYLSRDVDGHIIYLDEDCWLYSKFSRFMFFGKIKSTKPYFRNTQVNLEGGLTALAQFVDSPAMTNSLIDRSEFIYKHVKEKISEPQQEIINEFVKENYHKIINSDLGKRLMEDITSEKSSEPVEYSFQYLCDCCAKGLTEPEGYMLRTFEIVSSSKYWEDLFKKHNLSHSDTDLEIRIEYFNGVSGQDNPWIVCEQCSDMFTYDKIMAKEFLKHWIVNRSNYSPPQSKNTTDHLSEDEMQSIARILLTV